MLISNSNNSQICFSLPVICPGRCINVHFKFLFREVNGEYAPRKEIVPQYGIYRIAVSLADLVELGEQHPVMFEQVVTDIEVLKFSIFSFKPFAANTPVSTCLLTTFILLATFLKLSSSNKLLSAPVSKANHIDWSSTLPLINITII